VAAGHGRQVVGRGSHISGDAMSFRCVGNICLNIEAEDVRILTDRVSQILLVAGR
jgi:hypothetical protein